MVSIQSTVISYIEETESCYPTPCTIIYKQYTKGSVMDALMKYSPLFAFLAQYSKLDDLLDSDEFNGTCFAPCLEYSDKYLDFFQKNIDHLKARHIVLASLLRAPMASRNLNYEQMIPTLNKFFSLDIFLDVNGTVYLNNARLKLLKTDYKCTNGILHIVSGLIN